MLAYWQTAYRSITATRERSRERSRARAMANQRSADSAKSIPSRPNRRCASRRPSLRANLLNQRRPPAFCQYVAGMPAEVSASANRCA
jgi:hypothetical protein